MPLWFCSVSNALLNSGVSNVEPAPCSGVFVDCVDLTPDEADPPHATQHSSVTLIDISEANVSERMRRQRSKLDVFPLESTVRIMTSRLCLDLACMTKTRGALPCGI